MFNFLIPAHWQPKGVLNLLTDAVDAIKAIPDFVSDTCERHDISPASIASAAATQGAQALSATANFAVTATGALLTHAWSGLVNYGPPLAQGIWSGLTTYGPPLAQEVWTGVKTYGPPTAMAIGKGTAWAGTNAWEAAKWGGNALSAAAEEHHVKDRALVAGRELLDVAEKGLVMLADKAVADGLPALAYLKNQTLETGKALLTEAQAGWELLSGKGIDLGPLEDIGIYGSPASESQQPALHADNSPPQEVRDAADAPGAALQAAPVLAFDDNGVVATAQIAASAHSATVIDPQVWQGGAGMEKDLHSSSDFIAQKQDLVAAGEIPHDTGQSQAWQTAHGQGEIPSHIDVHVHVHICLIGAMPPTGMLVAAAYG